jgi:peroxiredoxin/predicted 2-oxoglutarate/Fe(II)-dependent dioxygenase YbiX
MNAPNAPQPAFNRLMPGDPAPWFFQRCQGLPNFAFDTLAGRYVVLCFYMSAADPQGRSAIDAMLRNRAMFDDDHASFFGISLDPQDEAEERVKDSMPGVRFVWDFDESVSRLYGALPSQPAADGKATPFRRFWMVIDPTLHVFAVYAFGEDDQHQAIFDLVKRLPRPERFAGFEIPAPILVLPNVLEPQLCQRLIELYDSDGGTESGVMRNKGDKTVGILDGSFKRRKDYTITDQALITLLQQRVKQRVAPEIEKLFFMPVTRMERYIVGCYAAEDGGHFRPHRDNKTPLTAHRRYAISVNLNGDFDGGEVSFPEYNRRGHKAPPGWAVIFPCAILHAVSQVTRGRRYAFLPFVYDEAGARIRAANLQAAPAPVDAVQPPAEAAQAPAEQAPQPAAS